MVGAAMMCVSVYGYALAAGCTAGMFLLSEKKTGTKTPTGLFVFFTLAWPITLIALLFVSLYLRVFVRGGRQ